VGALKAAQIHQLTTSYKPQPLSTVLEHAPEGNRSPGGPSCAFPTALLHFTGFFLPRICPKELTYIMASIEVMARSPSCSLPVQGYVEGEVFRGLRTHFTPFK